MWSTNTIQKNQQQNKKPDALRTDKIEVKIQNMPGKLDPSVMQ